jgi:hypothetical protein
MKRIFLFCFILFYFIPKSQNLVPNPSFEQGYDCISGRLDNAIGWYNTNNGVGISAHMQVCQIDPWVNAPRQYLSTCFQSYQTIRTGNAYSEFAIYTQTTNNDESKHPSVKLTDTLEAGKIYCVTYFVSMWNNAVYSIDKLGALFTPTPFPYYITGTTTPSVVIAGQYTPQVVTPPGVVFEDTLGWEEVSGTFTAVGNEAYLTLGDFFLHSQHLIKNSYPTNCNGLADYYIDDVSVEVVEIAKAKNDTLIMQGDSAVIGLNNSEAALFSWQPSAGLSCANCPNPKASPTITTTYTVTKTQCKSVTSDVITVTVSPVGIHELINANSIKISPNPATDVLNIDILTSHDVTKELSIKITDVLGKELVLTDYQKQINISELETGIYFVSIIQGNKTLVTKKIIKE